jgi:hypothetical protein
MAYHDLTTLPLNWGLAVDRLQRDITDDFFPDPLQHHDVLNAARRGITHVVRPEHYATEPAESWEVPKPNLTLRHCIHVSAIDRLVYQALIDHLAPLTDHKLSHRAYAFRLRSATSSDMFLNSVQQNKRFEADSRTLLKSRPDSSLVTVDIAQYFENISFRKLKDALVGILGPQLDAPTTAVVEVLMSCLASWSPYGNCGVPQNMNASSYLGNIYLHSLDQQMVASGWEYFRYMDDIKVVVPDEARARLALKTIIGQLRSLELSVNSQKTGIVRSGSLEWQSIANRDDSEIDEVEAIIVRRQPEELLQCADKLFATALRLIAEGLTRDYHFRFAINRLTSLRKLPTLSIREPDGFGATLLSMLRTQPSDTAMICGYFSARSSGADAAEQIADLLVTDPVFVYEWQNYHLWVQVALSQLTSDRLLDRARQILGSGASEPEMAGAAVYLGTVGGSFDRDLVQRILSDEKHQISVRRALCIALQRLDNSDRKLLFAGLSALDGSIGVLARYLSRLPRPAYISRPRRTTLRGLLDAMPDNFS